MPTSTQLPGESLNTSPVLLAQAGLELLLSSSQLLAVGEQRKGGLILCKENHAEFAGPGAAVGSSVEQKYKAVIAIGSPNLVPVISHADRQKAYSRRIQWGRWLYRIVEHPDPVLRAEKLFSSFEEFFGYQVAATLSDEVLGSLVGVLPQTIQAVRLQYQSSGKPTEIGHVVSAELTGGGAIVFKDCNLTFDERLKLLGNAPNLTDNFYKMLRSA